MIAAKCELCNKIEDSLFIVCHKKRGRIRICENCLKQNSKHLLSRKACSCC